MDGRMKPQLLPTTETFSPNFERSDEGSSYLLKVNLPGFNRKDFSVQVDQTGKLTIKGKRQSEKNTYVLLDETYNLPQDSDCRKIAGKFDDGCLALTVPKMVKPMHEEKKPKEMKPLKPLPSLDSMKKINGQGEKQDALQDEKMKKIGQEREKVADEKPQPKTSPPTHEKEIEEREKVATETSQQPKASPPIEQKKIEEREKVAAETSQQAKVSPPNEEKSDIQDEGSSKKKITDDQDERKNGLLCKRKFREEGWLEYHGVLDSLMERINNNKKVILVAVVALSVGFYVSHKIRSSGK